MSQPSGPSERRPRGLWSTRGVVLLAGGASAALAAAVLGEPDLLRMGIFVAALPLASLAWTLLRAERRLGDLVVHRHVDPPQVATGTPVTVRLTLTRHGARGGTVLAEDLLPPGVSRRTGPPRMLLGGSRATAEVTYTLVPLRRGTISLGPVRARALSPLGLCDRRVAVPGTTDVVVTPRVVPLPVARGLRQPRSVGGHRPRRPGSAPTEDASVRPYRRGDDLRLVHWRSSARRGELQVREGVDLRVPRSIVVLDVSRTPGPGFEAAVDLAASVGTHLLSLDHDLDLALHDGREVLATMRCATPADLLARLSSIEAGDASTALSASPGAALRLGGGDVVVLCTRSGADLRGLASSLPVVASRCSALALVAEDVDRVSSLATGAGAGARGARTADTSPLDDQGWVVRTLRGAEDLRPTWLEDTDRAAAVAGAAR
ncbi:DUF58 domain-containing protein [Nocardioidaceae bacterium]|nr:DUF58 domain-containing protein [Nocardioidaceae bacterium]